MTSPENVQLAANFGLFMLAAGGFGLIAGTTLARSGVVRRGAAWCGVVRRGAAWCGVVRRGAAWCGVQTSRVSFTPPASVIWPSVPSATSGSFL